MLAKQTLRAGALGRAPVAGRATRCVRVRATEVSTATKVGALGTAWLSATTSFGTRPPAPAHWAS